MLSQNYSAEWLRLHSLVFPSSSCVSVHVRAHTALAFPPSCNNMLRGMSKVTPAAGLSQASSAVPMALTCSNHTHTARCGLTRHGRLTLAERQEWEWKAGGQDEQPAQRGRRQQDREEEREKERVNDWEEGRMREVERNVDMGVRESE